VAAETRTLRPALWIPGLVHVDFRGGRPHLVCGPDVGWTMSVGVDDWKCTLVLAPRDACRARGYPMPEDEIDAERWPHVHAAARAATHVAVSAAEAATCIAQGIRVVEISWHRVSGGGLIEGRGGGPTRTFGGELYATRLRPVSNTAGPADHDEDDTPPYLIDRILHAVSGGALSEATAELARDLATLLRPEVIDWPSGPWRRDARRTHAGLTDWNARLVAIHERAAPHLEDARALVERLRSATSDVIDVPLYGHARRVVLPKAILGDDPPPLRLAARTDWQVDDVESWYPRITPTRRTIRPWTDPLQQVRVSPGFALLVLVILVLAVIALALAR
jgi:hypothetical protein